MSRWQKIWAALRGVGAGLLFDVGGLVVFYVLMYSVGLKAAIAGTIVFVAIDTVRRRILKLGFPKIYVMSTALVIVFGLIDIFSKNPFMLRWEGVLTNLAVMAFFLAGLRGKSVFQELVEQQSGQSQAEPHMIRLFRLMTLLWALYFLAKAIFDIWTGLTMSLPRALAVRQLVGFAGMGVMVLLTMQAEKFLRFINARSRI